MRARAESNRRSINDLELQSSAKPSQLRDPNSIIGTAIKVLMINFLSDSNRGVNFGEIVLNHLIKKVLK